MKKLSRGWIIVWSLDIFFGLLGFLIAAVSNWRATVIPVPFMMFMVEFMIVAYLTGLYYMIYVRDLSTTIITDSGLRESLRGPTPLTDVDQGGDPWPPQTLYCVGGGAASYFAFRGKHALQARKSSIERFGDDTIITYGPTQPVPGFFLKALAPFESDQLARSSESKVIASPKSDTIFHFTLLDSLHGLDSQALRQQQTFIVNRFGRIGAEENELSRMGKEALVAEFRNIAAATRAQTKKEALKGWLSGRGDEVAEAEAEADKERVK